MSSKNDADSTEAEINCVAEKGGCDCDCDVSNLCQSNPSAHYYWKTFGQGS